MRLPKLALAGLATAAIVAVGCGDGSDSSGSSEGSFVGKVAGTDAYVAVVSNGEQVTGYLCDGKRVSIWLRRSELDDGEAELVDRQGDQIGEVELEGSTGSGEIEVAGQPHDFSLALAEGEAGLYRKATGTPNRPGYRESGWVVLADGSTRGATNFIDTGTDLVVGSAPKRTSATQVSPGFIETGADF